MRPVRRLFRFLIVTAAVAAALGGAAALGSTLFAAPPKDAAEFARWVAAGSENGKGEEGKAERARRERTAAERRFARELAALCVRYERQVDDLEAPRTPDEMLDVLGRLLPIARRYHSEAGRLDPPKRYRAALARLLELDRSGLTTLEAMRSALLHDDEGAYGAALAKLDVLTTRSHRIFRRIGAAACADD